MTEAIQSQDTQLIQSERLRQFLNWFFLATSFITVLLVTVAVLVHVMTIGLTGGVTACMSIVTLIARAQLARAKLKAAVIITCACFFAGATGAAFIMPTLLPVLIFGPTLALAVALPYVDSRTLRNMSIATWLVIVLMSILTQIIEPLEKLPALLNSSVIVILLAVASPLLLLLLWQFHRRLTEMLAQTQAANTSLRAAMVAAEEARAAAEQASELKSQFLANMSHEDGYAVLNRIRSNPLFCRTRVIAVTANVLPQDEIKARVAGFDGFIGKPLDLDRFPDQIRAVLAGQAVWMPR